MVLAKGQGVARYTEARAGSLLQVLITRRAGAAETGYPPACAALQV